MRAIVFAKRNVKEILRDPISFVFCLGFPVGMLAIFRVLQCNVGDGWMTAVDLIPGVSVFSLTFVMLYETLLVSKDRTTSFLTRLYHSPMRTADFVVGYALPGVILSLLQSLLTYLVGVVIALIPGGRLGAKGFEIAAKLVGEQGTLEYFVTLPYAGFLWATLTALPVIVFFVACGVLFGSLLNERSAPGVASAVISGAGILSGAWMPLAQMGGFEDFCRVLPFYPAVTLARSCFAMQTPTWAGFWLPLLTVILWALAVALAAILVFHKGRYSDKK